MTSTFLVGDVRQRMAELVDGSFDLILCSPPFLALRSYLPDGHPDKHLEIGSEATPAEFLDTMLELTAEWGRLLAPHGSIAIELGDTYAGGGGWGDYPDEKNKTRMVFDGTRGGHREAAKAGGWPLAKSLVCVPQLYQIALAYGINPLTGTPSPAGKWRVRNLKAWIRSNPPVGALGDKERPATSYIIVACRATDRWFDLDAVRSPVTAAEWAKAGQASGESYQGGDGGYNHGRVREPHAGGAPPRDWVHSVDLILDTELANRQGKTVRHGGGTQRARTTKSGDEGRGGNWSTLDELGDSATSTGAQGVHLRRALEHAGILHPQDFYDISPKGYSGAHYAVWPPELARRLIDEMCPRHVCLTCGEPRRRLVDVAPGVGGLHQANAGGSSTVGGHPNGHRSQMGERQATTVGWSDCGHGTNCRLPVYEDQYVPATYRDDGKLIARERTVPVMVDPGHCDDTHWRPGRVLDPFVGSGTTLAVATGMARDSVGIDLDARNATLAYERVGMFLTVDGDMAQPDLTPPIPLEEWIAMDDYEGL